MGIHKYRSHQNLYAFGPKSSISLRFQEIGAGQEGFFIQLIAVEWWKY